MIPFPETTLDAEHSLNPFEKSILLHLLAASKPKVILELGVYKGITTKLMCEWLRQFKIESTVVGFDLEEVLKELVSSDSEIAKLKEQGELKFMPGYLPGTLDDYLKKEGGIIDFVLIDAQHDYPSVYGELKRIWPYLSPNGFIVCHDYHKPRIQYAIERFSRETNAKYLPILANPQETIVYSSLVVLTKPKMEFKLMRWLVYHFQIKSWKGYYVLKKLFRKFFESID
jgi:predicted O-methyltransferase YrrM